MGNFVGAIKLSAKFKTMKLENDVCCKELFVMLHDVCFDLAVNTHSKVRKVDSIKLDVSTLRDSKTII